MWWHDLPLSNKEINMLEGTMIPSTLNVDSFIYNYFHRSLYQRLYSVFEWENVPETWNKKYMMLIMLLNGWFAVVDSKKYGVIPQFATFAGKLDVMWQPRKLNVVNYWLQLKNLTIGKDCEIVTLAPDYHGAGDILHYFAEKLACQDSSINQSIINTRQAHVWYPRSKAQAQSLKKMEDKINSGQSSVFMDFQSKTSNKLDEINEMLFFDTGVGVNFITDKQLAVYRTIIHEFDSEIGLPNNPRFNSKNDLSTVEVETNNAETDSRLITWLDNINDSLELVNKMFNLYIKCSQRKFSTPNSGSEEKLNNQGERSDLGL